MRLKLDRPLVFFDLETTGTDPRSDRIVEICVLKLSPDGGRETRTRLVNPERPIPPGATAVHKIRDEDVRDQPTFREIARGLLEFIGDADLGGFNVARFDIPLLDREFFDAGLDLGVPERRIVDAMRIFHKQEPRDLTAALKFYLGKEHGGAHEAEADVIASLDVLVAQLERYEDLPDDVEALHEWQFGAREPVVDREGKFVWREGEAVFSFGKHAGKTLRAVAEEARDYLQWFRKADFPDDARKIVSEALKGTFPEEKVKPSKAPPRQQAFFD